jgi:hypothetical protein
VAAWLTFVRERFSLPVHLLVSGGFAATGVVLGTGRMQLRPLAVSVGGIIAFFALLRLMDEDKDLDKDRIAHPDRPLPRGLLESTRVPSRVDTEDAPIDGRSSSRRTTATSRATTVPFATNSTQPSASGD